MAQINYDRASKDYDLVRELRLEDLAAWKTHLATHIQAGDFSVLDLGAGTGLFAQAFVEWFGVKVVAVEPSSPMREIAARKRPHEQISYLEGDAEHIPAPDSQFDAAWLSTVAHHFPDLSAAALELRRVLKPNAPLVIRSCFPERAGKISLFQYFPEAQQALRRFPSVEQVADAFSSAAFEIQRVEDVPQITAPNLYTYRQRFRYDIRHTDTTLVNLSDDAYAEGIARLDEALSRGSGMVLVMPRRRDRGERG